MNALILEKGEGGRLRPLTCNQSEFMVRLCGKPAVAYLMDLLLEHDIRESVIISHSFPETVEDYFATRQYGTMQVAFFREEESLDTVGNVRQIINRMKWEEDTLIIITGNVLCDFDLKAAARFHQQSGATLTVVGKTVKNPCEYVLIEADEKGKVQGFSEEPGFVQALTGLANTGIYFLNPRCLELLKEGENCDFVKDLFPRMLDRGDLIMVYKEQGYWCDIKDLDAFIRCQQDILLGRVHCRVEGKRDEQGNIFAHLKPSGKYHLTAPCYIGQGVQIGEGARVEGLSVLDQGCSVGKNSHIAGGILLPECFVDRKAEIIGGVVCAGASVGMGATLLEGGVVGSEAVVEEKALLHPGAKVWPLKRVERGVHLTTTLREGTARRAVFDDEGIVGSVGVEITPEFCVRLGAAAATESGGEKIGVATDGSNCAQALRVALFGGILGAGGQPCDFGECLIPQFHFCCNFSSLSRGFYVQTMGEKAVIQMVDKGGMNASRKTEQAIEQFLRSEIFQRIPAEKYSQVVDLSGMKAIYKNELYRYAPYGLMGMKIQISCTNSQIYQMIWDVLIKLGARQSDDPQAVFLEISDDAQQVNVIAHGISFDSERLMCICAAYEMSQGKELAVSSDAPGILDKVAERLGKKLLRYHINSSDQRDRQIREIACCQYWLRDPLMTVVKFLSLLHIQRVSPADANSSVPDFVVETASIFCKGNPNNLLKELPGNMDEQREGIVVDQPQGVVILRPSKLGNRIRIMAEAVNSEVARELCQGFEKLLEEKKLDREP